jgi:hypothetical protein
MAFYQGFITYILSHIHTGLLIFRAQLWNLVLSENLLAVIKSNPHLLASRIYNLYQL